jgi:uncharacterized protein DUF6932
MGQLARFIIFESFVTAKREPNDVDIFMLMDDAFDARQVESEAAIIFDPLQPSITKARWLHPSEVTV